jgi:hypothetical protein
MRPIGRIEAVHRLGALGRPTPRGPGASQSSTSSGWRHATTRGLSQGNEQPPRKGDGPRLQRRWRTCLDGESCVHPVPSTDAVAPALLAGLPHARRAAKPELRSSTKQPARWASPERIHPVPEERASGERAGGRPEAASPVTRYLAKNELRPYSSRSTSS